MRHNSLFRACRSHECVPARDGQERCRSGLPSRTSRFDGRCSTRQDLISQGCNISNLLRMICVLFGLLAFVIGPGGVLAAEESVGVAEIVERANRVSYYQGEDGRARVRMVIADAQGRERNREFTILRRDNRPEEEAKMEAFKKDEFTGDQRFYVYFHAPPDVEETVFMVWKHVSLDQDDDRWLYLPALDLVKRIAAGDERTSFVGSHFFYEDVSGRNTNEDEDELVRTTDTYYVLKNTPKEPKKVEFSHYRMWIHRDTFLPIKTEYFDERGEKYREYTVLSVENIEGYITVTRAEMKDLRSGGKTVMSYSTVDYDVGLPKDIFTERYLRRAPVEYLKGD